MTSITMYKGLPGCGKSTAARNTLKELGGPAKAVRLNKDLTREMLHFSEFTGKSEKYVVMARNNLIRTFLGAGLSVIIDDTNLNPAHETTLSAMAKEFGVAFEVIDMTDVPLETCIANDLKRERSVGEGVIMQMHDKHLAPTPTWLDQKDPNKIDTVIVDIDGTVAWNVPGGRSFYDWDRVGEDIPHKPVHHLVTALLATGQHITFLSGRDGSCEDITYKWLVEHFGIYLDSWKLIMRKAGDNRQDAEVKLEILDNLILPEYNVLYAIDDRLQVVRAWCSRGITVFDVNSGRF